MNSTAATTSTDRPLELRGRRDLIAEPIHFRGTRYWSVKDPLSLRYYQLCDEERFILEQVDGECSFEEIKRRFEAKFAPRQIDSGELYAFLGTLHREGLLTSQVTGQAEQLFERHERAARREKLQTFTNLLAIRFRGLDPEPFLQVLYPAIRWMFSRLAVSASLALIFGAVFSLVVYAETFITRLPRLQSFLSVENIVLMAIVLACCKVLHELGHALTCKHFGGECHELGIMLLVFTPCLYCNVSDAWMMRNKWQRIAISAAGIYVELLLAAVCTFLWWFSQPGLCNSIFLNVMFVCSVSTILFNGNPLLRYDGYFILADLVELPNLRQQSQTHLRHIVSRILGTKTRETWTFPTQHTAQLLLYGVASLVYRWVLVAGILLMVYRALEPYRLESIAYILGAFVLGGMLFPPLWQIVHVAREPRIDGGRRRWRTAGLVVTLSVAAVVIGMVPVSHHVVAPVVIEPADAARVHATVPGTLTQFVSIGQFVSEGEMVATLADANLVRELVALRGDRDVEKLYAEQLRKLQVLERGVSDEGAGSRIVTAEEALAATERRLSQKLEDHARLTITAPQAGYVLSDRPRRPIESSERLPTWSGTPLDERNVGGHLDTDAVVCLIGDPSKVKGIAFVDQTEIERIAIGQSVRILVDELHEQVLTGTVTEIATVEVDQVAPELIAKRLLADDTNESTNAYYAVSIELYEGQPHPLLWSSGRAKVAVEPCTLAEFLYKQICHTFRLDL
ncbi:MAG: HlyD family efflux transporter periplasmic adaptor subunit [Planctomycetes bacterium]|nr:HlyD family efflux transporter periplasmic adaptor subunit [Planctomycetota bacterium]